MYITPDFKPFKGAFRQKLINFESIFPLTRTDKLNLDLKIQY